MSDTDYNVKHPKLPFKGNYPNIHVYQDASGYQIIRSLEPGSEAHFEVQPSGSYTGHAADGSRVEAVYSKTHAYHGDGVSQTVDGEHDQKVSGNMRSNSDGGRSSENAGDSYSGGGGHTVSSGADTSVTHSEGDIYHMSAGDHVSDHTGDVHQSITGDYVQSVTGNRSEIINGEWAINSQGGNVDLQIDGGKLRNYCAQDILIESQTKITLKVGGSTITITPDNITIVSSRVDINP
jgi:hypothetical protein